jgi:CheY-like chemotaxis protein
MGLTLSRHVFRITLRRKCFVPLLPKWRGWSTGEIRVASSSMTPTPPSDPMIPFPSAYGSATLKASHNQEKPDGWASDLPVSWRLTTLPTQPLKMKILLVEDHPGLAKISCHLLRNIHGHDVEHVATAQAALAALANSIPDMILLDLSLPDMHGYRLAEQLRKQPDFDRTILVALTGYGITGDAERSAAAGMDAHFRKPMDFGLLPTIKRAAPGAPLTRLSGGVTA